MLYFIGKINYYKSVINDTFIIIHTIIIIIKSYIIYNYTLIIIIIKDVMHVQHAAKHFSIVNSEAKASMGQRSEISITCSPIKLFPDYFSESK